MDLVVMTMTMKMMIGTSLHYLYEIGSNIIK